MGYALISSTVASSTDQVDVTTSPIDTSGANLIIVSGLNYHTSLNIAISDSKLNTWTALTLYSESQSATILWYCFNPTVGSGHTFSLTSIDRGQTFAVCGVVAFSGSTSSPFESENGDQSGSGSVQPGSVTPMEDGALIVSSLSCFTGTAIDIDSGFTNNTLPFGNTNASFGGGLGWLIQSVAAAVNPTWTFSGSSGNHVSSIAVFSPAIVSTPLSASTTGGILSTTTPVSGVPFTLTVQGSGSGVDVVTVNGPGGTQATCTIQYPVPPGQPGSLMMMGMGN
jgi:hypothetical protein